MKFYENEKFLAALSEAFRDAMAHAGITILDLDCVNRSVKEATMATRPTGEC